MVLEYFSSKKAKKQDAAPKTPVLSEEDELFLKQITAEEAAPPLPMRPTVILDNGAKVEGKDAQTALMDGANQIPLPASPTSPPVDGVPKDTKGNAKSPGEKKTVRDYLSYVPTIPARMKSFSKRKTGDGSKSADAAKANQSPDIRPGAESKNEQDDLTNILDQLNLAAVNNRAFSFTKESQELMDKFKVVLKDLINGVPTAYDDLEKLLTGSEKQLSAMFAAMPPFIQTLIKSLPAKVTASLGPEVLAASAEKPGLQLPGKKKSKRFRTPSLKTLVGEQGAVVTMLRSIFNFLKLRFPAVISGTNVLLSLAVFLLLFVFWYCHKRGKETRLERERLAGESAEVSESDMSGLEDSAVLGKSAVREPTQSAAESEKQNQALADLPSVRDLPSPASTPLPQTPQPVAAGEKPKILAAT